MRSRSFTVATLATLLLADPAPRSVGAALESCASVRVVMGKVVTIGEVPMKVPECTKEVERCGIFFCSTDTEIFQGQMAFARCSLHSKHHYLPFIVESASATVEFVPPFSGRLSCDPLEPEAISGQQDFGLIDAAAREGYSCNAPPRPQRPTPTTTARCWTTP